MGTLNLNISYLRLEVKCLLPAKRPGIAPGADVNIRLPFRARFHPDHDYVPLISPLGLVSFGEEELYRQLPFVLLHSIAAILKLTIMQITQAHRIPFVFRQHTQRLPSQDDLLCLSNEHRSIFRSEQARRGKDKGRCSRGSQCGRGSRRIGGGKPDFGRYGRCRRCRCGCSGGRWSVGRPARHSRRDRGCASQGGGRDQETETWQIHRWELWTREGPRSESNLRQSTGDHRGKHQTQT
jgi:hypothetical protein